MSLFQQLVAAKKGPKRPKTTIFKGLAKYRRTKGGGWNIIALV